MHRDEKRIVVLLCTFFLLMNVGFAKTNEISSYRTNEITDMNVLYRNALLGVNELSDMARDKVKTFSDVYAIKEGVKDDQIKVYETTQMIERIESRNGYIEEKYVKTSIVPLSTSRWWSNSSGTTIVYARCEYSVRSTDGGLTAELRMDKGQGKVNDASPTSIAVLEIVACASSFNDIGGRTVRNIQSPVSGSVYSTGSPCSTWFPVGHNPEFDTQVTAIFSGGGSVSITSYVQGVYD